MEEHQTHIHACVEKSNDLKGVGGWTGDRVRSTLSVRILDDYRPNECLPIKHTETHTSIGLDDLPFTIQRWRLERSNSRNLYIAAPTLVLTAPNATTSNDHVHVKEQDVETPQKKTQVLRLLQNT